MTTKRRPERKCKPYVEGDAGRYFDKERKDLRIGARDIVNDLEGSDRFDVGQGRVARRTLTLREEDERLWARVARVVERDGRELALVYFSCGRASNIVNQPEPGTDAGPQKVSLLTVDEGAQGGKLCACRGCGSKQSSAGSNGSGNSHLVEPCPCLHSAESTAKVR